MIHIETLINDARINTKIKILPISFIVAFSLFGVSCTTINSDSEDVTAVAEAVEYADGLPVEDKDEVVSSELELKRELPQKDELVEPEEALQNAAANNRALPKIPLSNNKYVDHWLEYFQGRGRESMAKFLRRSTRYLPFMKKVLVSYGLPEDLVYVAMIESGFNAKAHSSASAVGYWQFMRGTGRQYGLSINNYIDERRDPVLSTHAAARYLKGLYHLFGSWNLAIASYNVGENRMKYVVMKNYTRNFWDLVEKKKLPKETLSYIPKFNAARMISKNPAKYGFTNIAYEAPIKFDSIQITKSSSLSRFSHELGVKSSDLKRLNPQLRRDVIWVPRGEVKEFRVPQGMKRYAMNVRPKTYLKNLSNAYVGAKGYHLVKRGDNLIGIAKKYGTSVSSIRRINNLRRKSIIKIGMRLKVEGRKNRRRNSSRNVASNGKLINGYYKVKSGDNLITIAKRFRVSLSQLQKNNNLTRKSVLYIGKKLKIHSNKIHTVRTGETLMGIANKYDVSLTSLTKVNKLTMRSVLYVGTKIRIPSARL